MWTCFAGIVLWSDIMFLFANYIEGMIIEGTIIAWL